MSNIDYPVAMYLVTAHGRILKMEDAFEFAAVLPSAFQAAGLPLPEWRGITPDQFERHVDELRKRLVGTDEEGLNAAGSGSGAALDPDAG